MPKFNATPIAQGPLRRLLLLTLGVSSACRCWCWLGCRSHRRRATALRLRPATVRSSARRRWPRTARASRCRARVGTVSLFRPTGKWATVRSIVVLEIGKVGEAVTLAILNSQDKRLTRLTPQLTSRQLFLFFETPEFPVPGCPPWQAAGPAPWGIRRVMGPRRPSPFAHRRLGALRPWVSLSPVGAASLNPRPMAGWALNLRSPSTISVRAGHACGGLATVRLETSGLASSGGVRFGRTPSARWPHRPLTEAAVRRIVTAT